WCRARQHVPVVTWSSSGGGGGLDVTRCVQVAHLSSGAATRAQDYKLHARERRVKVVSAQSAAAVKLMDSASKAFALRAASGILDLGLRSICPRSGLLPSDGCPPFSQVRHPVSITLVN
ncbi:hypothetical protein CORC01_01843, partial [Colletotrichum orchidophilum]